MDEHEFAALTDQAAAEQWGKAAADAAAAGGQEITDATVGLWLDKSEPFDARQLRTLKPAAWSELRHRASDCARAHAAVRRQWG